MATFFHSEVAASCSNAYMMNCKSSLFPPTRVEMLQRSAQFCSWTAIDQSHYYSSIWSCESRSQTQETAGLSMLAQPFSWIIGVDTMRWGIRRRSNPMILNPVRTRSADLHCLVCHTRDETVMDLAVRLSPYMCIPHSCYELHPLCGRFGPAFLHGLKHHPYLLLLLQLRWPKSKKCKIPH